MEKLKYITKYFLGIYCAVVRSHSRMITSFWVFQYCGRCGEQIGDNLGGVGIGACISVDKYHRKNCKVCNKVRRSWKGIDKITMPLVEKLLRWVNK